MDFPLFPGSSGSSGSSSSTSLPARTATANQISPGKGESKGVEILSRTGPEQTPANLSSGSSWPLSSAHQATVAGKTLGQALVPLQGHARHSPPTISQSRSDDASGPESSPSRKKRHAIEMEPDREDKAEGDHGHKLPKSEVSEGARSHSSMSSSLDIDGLPDQQQDYGLDEFEWRPADEDNQWNFAPTLSQGISNALLLDGTGSDGKSRSAFMSTKERSLQEYLESRQAAFSGSPRHQSLEQFYSSLEFDRPSFIREVNEILVFAQFVPWALEFGESALSILFSAGRKFLDNAMLAELHALIGATDHRWIANWFRSLYASEHAPLTIAYIEQQFDATRKASLEDLGGGLGGDDVNHWRWHALRAMVENSGMQLPEAMLRRHCHDILTMNVSDQAWQHGSSPRVLALQALYSLRLQPERLPSASDSQSPLEFMSEQRATILQCSDAQLNRLATGMLVTHLYEAGGHHVTADYLLTESTALLDTTTVSGRYTVGWIAELLQGAAKSDPEVLSEKQSDLLFSASYPYDSVTWNRDLVRLVIRQLAGLIKLPEVGSLEKVRLMRDLLIACSDQFEDGADEEHGQEIDDDALPASHQSKKAETVTPPKFVLLVHHQCAAILKLSDEILSTDRKLRLVGLLYQLHSDAMTQATLTENLAAIRDLPSDLLSTSAVGRSEENRQYLFNALRAANRHLSASATEAKKES